MKRESVEEFLRRGGKITKLPVGDKCLSISQVGPTRKPGKPMTKDDYRDGNIPNAKWIGGIR